MNGLVLELRELRDGFLDLDRIDVARGEVVALLGPNGAGKTRLVETIMGLRRAAGDIRLDGKPIGGLAPERRARQGLGYVPQGRRLFPGLTVRDTLLLASRQGPRKRRVRLESVSALFPDLAERMETRAWKLSGGQQQMLAIGRALMAEPALLVLDEPSVGLAPKLAAGLLQHLPAIAAEGAGVLLAEQNARAALRVADRAYVIGDGRIVRAGAAADLRDDPAMAGFFLSG